MGKFFYHQADFGISKDLQKIIGFTINLLTDFEVIILLSTPLLSRVEVEEDGLRSVWSFLSIDLQLGSSL